MSMTTIKDLAQMGQAIRARRKARGLSQIELAQHAGISRSALQKLEENRGTLQMDIVWKLLRTLSLDLAIVERGGAR